MGYKGWEHYIPGAKRKEPERQWQGRRNRANGALLEKCILEACDWYRAHGMADIDKTPEPFKVLSGMHRLPSGVMGFEGVFAKKAQPDFKGTLQGGRAVVFEAKMTTTDRIRQEEVTEAQAASMRSHSALGAMVFVVVSMDLQRYYRVPWAVWEGMKERYGHKYMNAEELDIFRVHVKDGILRFL